MSAEPSFGFTPAKSPYGATDPSMQIKAAFATSKLTHTAKQIRETSHLELVEPSMNK